MAAAADAVATAAHANCQLCHRRLGVACRCGSIVGPCCSVPAHNMCRSCAALAGGATEASAAPSAGSGTSQSWPLIWRRSASPITDAGRIDEAGPGGQRDRSSATIAFVGLAPPPLSSTSRAARLNSSDDERIIEEFRRLGSLPTPLQQVVDQLEDRRQLETERLLTDNNNWLASSGRALTRCPRLRDEARCIPYIVPTDAPARILLFFARCAICGEKFAGKQLKRHEQEKHGEYFKCVEPGCYKKFTCGEDLRRHSRDLRHAIPMLFRPSFYDPDFPLASAASLSGSSSDVSISTLESSDWSEAPERPEGSAAPSSAGVNPH